LESITAIVLNLKFIVQKISTNNKDILTNSDILINGDILINRDILS